MNCTRSLKSLWLICTTGVTGGGGGSRTTFTGRGTGFLTTTVFAGVGVAFTTTTCFFKITVFGVGVAFTTTTCFFKITVFGVGVAFAVTVTTCFLTTTVAGVAVAFTVATGFTFFVIPFAEGVGVGVGCKYSVVVDVRAALPALGTKSNAAMMAAKIRCNFIR